MTIKNKKWLQKNIAELIRSRFSYWLSATSMTTSMSLGTQKGFFTDQINAPNNQHRSENVFRHFIF